MARGVNKVILIGNLGQDPDVRFLPNGNPVANLRIATTDSWTDKQSGQRQERVEWHSVVLFNKLAEIAQQYVKKGSRIYIEGRLQTRKWQGQDGQDRYTTEIVGNDMQMLDSRQGGQQQGGQQGGHQQQGGYGGGNPQGSNYGGGMPPQGGQQGAQPPTQGQQQSGSQGGNYGAPSPGNFDDFDDEILY